MRRSRVFGLAALVFFVTGWLVWSLATVALAVPNKLYTIAGSSMTPTLRMGDRIAVREGDSERPKRGEIWVLNMPKASKLFGAQAVEPIVGLPGETVEVKDGQLYIEGRPVVEPYVTAPINYNFNPLKLGPDEYFALGDNRNNSNDSHLWGPLPANHLIGRIKLRVWPVSSAGGF